MRSRTKITHVSGEQIREGDGQMLTAERKVERLGSISIKGRLSIRRMKGAYKDAETGTPASELGALH